MTNLEKYNRIFCDTFQVEENVLNEKFDNTSVEVWDSIKQLCLITSIEETFDIMLDTEDIIGLVSYFAGKDILGKYGVIL